MANRRDPACKHLILAYSIIYDRRRLLRSSRFKNAHASIYLFDLSKVVGSHHLLFSKATASRAVLLDACLSHVRRTAFLENCSTTFFWQCEFGQFSSGSGSMVLDVWLKVRPDNLLWELSTPRLLSFDRAGANTYRS